MSLLTRLWKGLPSKNETTGYITVSHYEGKRHDTNAYQRWWDANKHTTMLLDALIEETTGMAGYLTEAQISFDNTCKTVLEGDVENKGGKT